MPVENFKTTVVVFEIKPFHTGTNPRTQREYTIWQVRARNMQGKEIDQYALRSFDKLPLNEPIEVEAQLYDGGNYGISYTLKPLQKKNASGGGQDARVKALEAKVEYLTVQLASVAGKVGMFIPEFESWARAQPVERQQPAEPTAPPPASASSPPPPAPTPAAPISAPPPTPPDPPTQVATSQPVQPEPPGSSFGDEPPF